jgi:hypothetical protein
LSGFFLNKAQAGWSSSATTGPDWNGSANRGRPDRGLPQSRAPCYLSSISGIANHSFTCDTWSLNDDAWSLSENPAMLRSYYQSKGTIIHRTFRVGRHEVTAWVLDTMTQNGLSVDTAATRREISNVINETQAGEGRLKKAAEASMEMRLKPILCE